ncbi:MAG: hypothetical protein JOZ83_00800, partial [Silvibacterium sp.]|nr:hypothetical protein [Silvibacterium sp.]
MSGWAYSGLTELVAVIGCLKPVHNNLFCASEAAMVFVKRSIRVAPLLRKDGRIGVMLKSQLSFLHTSIPPLRWAMGLVTAFVAFGIVLLLPPTHRAPYLIAYPGVVLSAWFFGVGAGIACAVVFGAITEYARFHGYLAVIRPIPDGSTYRLFLFIVGSVTVAWLCQQVSRL